MEKIFFKQFGTDHALVEFQIGRLMRCEWPWCRSNGTSVVSVASNYSGSRQQQQMYRQYFIFEKWTTLDRKDMAIDKESVSISCLTLGFE